MEKENIRVKLVRTSPIGGDCTASYAVNLQVDFTVGEFLAWVVSNKGDWGFFRVGSSREIEYGSGEITGSLDAGTLSRKIRKVTASGGWSRMDYYIIPE